MSHLEWMNKFAHVSDLLYSSFHVLHGSTGDAQAPVRNYAIERTLPNSCTQRGKRLWHINPSCLQKSMQSVSEADEGEDANHCRWGQHHQRQVRDALLLSFPTGYCRRTTFCLVQSCLWELLWFVVSTERRPCCVRKVRVCVASGMQSKTSTEISYFG